MNRLAWLLTPSVHQLWFALRLCIAIALSLYLAMWLQLERPYWSMLETAVMIQPIPGQAVVRAFARGIGTIVAACAGLTIVALFAQSYVLTAAALAIWIAACSFGANLLRNNLSYGFAIAALIAAMIVMLSHATQTPPFEIALMRTLECLLAAVVVASVNVLLAPPTGLRNYFNSRVALLRDLGAELKRLATFFGHCPLPDDDSASNAGNKEKGDAEDNDPHPALQALAENTLALEQTRRYVRYESPEFAGFDRLARRLSYDILSLISAASSLHIYLSSGTTKLDTRPLEALTEPAERLHDNPENANGAKAACDEAYSRILAIARESDEHGRPRSLANWVVVSRALGLVSRCRSIVVTHGLLVANQEQQPKSSKRRSEFGQPMDVKHAARNSLRTFIAASAAGVVWMNFHNQLPTVILMILVSALTTILATLPNPTAAIGGFAKGLIAAATAAFFLNFFLLPMAGSYAMLMLCLLPVVFAAGLAMAAPNPALAGPGRITVLLLALLLHIENRPIPGSSIGMLPGFPIYFQFVLGIAGAISLAALAFRLIFPVSPRQRLREQMAGVFKELAQGALHSRERFETRMYDRLNTLALSEIKEPFRFSARQAVQASINIGLEARSLVVIARRMSLPDHLREAIDDEMDVLRKLLTSRQMASAERVETRANALHDLAEKLLEHALGLEHEAERRLGIRAAICAELIASALVDYSQAFEHGTLRLSQLTATGTAAD